MTSTAIDSLLRFGVVPGALAAAWALTGLVPASAQTALPSPPEAKIEDENGVDLVSGTMRLVVTDVSMGPFSHSRRSYARPKDYAYGIAPNGGMVSSYELGVGLAQPENPWPNQGVDSRWKYTVDVGAAREDFYINSDDTLEATRGGVLERSAGSSFCSGGIWTYRSGTGVVATINMELGGGGDGAGAPGSCGRVLQVNEPNGLITRFTYYVPYPNANGGGWAMLRSVNRNDGYQLKYRYTGTTPIGVTVINNAYEYCDPAAESCSLSGSWPSSSYSWQSPTVFVITDSANRTARFTLDRHHRIASFKPFNATTDQVSYQYCKRNWYYDPWNLSQRVDPIAGEGEPCIVMVSSTGGGGPYIQLTQTHDRVVQVVNGGETWTYSFPSGSYGPYYYRYSSSSTGGGGSYAIVNTSGQGALTFFGNTHATLNFENSARNRVTSGQVSGQPAKTMDYDARDNVESDGITSAGYSTSCASLINCNRPNYTRDAAGNQTDFEYDPVHGGVLTVTSPGVQVNGVGALVRPQTRYTYIQRFAWFKNSSGTLVRSTEPIWKLATESSCRTSAATGAGCSTAGDEVVVSYDYGPDSGPNNLLLRGKTVTADGATLRTCYAYDQYSNKISETAPRAGLSSCP